MPCPRTLILSFALLGAIVTASPSGAVARPTPRACILSGRLDPPRGVEDEFVLRVVARGISHYPEMIHESRISRGRFRVTIPRADGELLALITSRDHQPIGWSFVADRSRLARRKTIVPEPWLEGTALITRDGQGVEDAEVRWAILVPTRSSLGLPWLVGMGRSVLRGVTPIRAAAAGLILEARKDELRGAERTLGTETVESGVHVALVEPRRDFRIRLWERVDGREMEARRLRVTAVTAAGEVVVPHEGAGEDRTQTFQGTAPAGIRALRIEYPGCRSVRVLGAFARAPESLEACPRPLEDLHSGEKDGEARLTIGLDLRQALEDPRPTVLPPCGMGRLVPTPGARGTIRRLGVEGSSRETLRPVYGRLGDLAASVPAGEYEVEVRGVLGLPRRERFTLPENTDVSAVMSVAGGSGIRLLVRGEKGELLGELSFRVRTADGGPASCEYEQIDLREPKPWRFTGPTFRDVPNEGLVRLEPGDYRVEILAQDLVTASYVIAAWPDVLTRLDTAFVEGEE